MSQLPPAGWHPDPLGRHAQRYWDGQQWTEHVADQAGNMSTDPLNLAPQQAQQTDQQAQDTAGWGGGDQATTRGDAAAGEGTWGQREATGEQRSWGEPGGGAEEAPSTPSWEQEARTDDTWGRDEPDAESTRGTTEESTKPSWAEPETTAEPETARPETTSEDRGSGSDWAAGGAAAAMTGAAAAPAGVSDERTTTEPTTTEPTTAQDTGPMAEATHAGAATEPVGAHATAASAGAVAVPVGDGMTARAANVVARNTSVTSEDRDDDHVHLAGTGQVWLGAQGRAISVIDVDTPGLTVSRAHLVAHSDGLGEEDAPDGIAGFDGVRFSGTGWVALAARGGTTEISTVGGIEVAASALVAYTTGLDVSHATTVSLVGRGTALVAGG